MARQDVAVLHLAAAEGLPGGPSPQQKRECLDRLDHYARTVADYTNRRLPDFEKCAQEYDYSEARFRIVLMVSMLQKVHRVRYNPAKMAPDTIHTAADSFIHGPLLGAGGTCASLPVVYAAVARRLGYPLRLVSAKQHLFCRWESAESALDVFNVEVNESGTSTPPDYHFREGLFAIHPDEERFCGYLRTLTPAEEFADFLALRATLWLQEKDYRRGLEAFAWCCRLAPRTPIFRHRVMRLIDDWRGHLKARMPPGFPRLTVQRPPRRHPWLDEKVERSMIECEAVERILDAPHHQVWWEALRRSPGTCPRPLEVPSRMDIRIVK